MCLLHFVWNKYVLILSLFSFYGELQVTASLPSTRIPPKIPVVTLRNTTTSTTCLVWTEPRTSSCCSHTCTSSTGELWFVFDVMWRCWCWLMQCMNGVNAFVFRCTQVVFKHFHFFNETRRNLCCQQAHLSNGYVSYAYNYFFCLSVQITVLAASPWTSCPAAWSSWWSCCPTTRTPGTTNTRLTVKRFMRSHNWSGLGVATVVVIVMCDVVRCWHSVKCNAAVWLYVTVKF